jgi:hypothetical protein
MSEFIASTQRIVSFPVESCTTRNPYVYFVIYNCDTIQQALHAALVSIAASDHPEYSYCLLINLLFCLWDACLTPEQ